ncbi:MAG: MBL fold metallo-hydrolase [Thermodesulfobacteriota bacterium]|nr:MBL fold metallo-hydrolase [Thermodesulfobacteriota bacterium]
MDANITHVSNDLFLITLTPPIPGFDDFIGCWLYRGNTSFIVDPGPSVTSKALASALQQLKISRLDYIFLTHIHIDHAGGVGNIAALFPESPVICHKSGIPHLADPSRLWEGSIKTLGDTAKAYGPIKPVSCNRLIPADEFKSDLITPVFTPGHSPHHVSYLTEKYLFAGEAGGVFLSLDSGSEYLRPATPPRFFLEISTDSIDTLIEKKPRNICYGHYGIKENAVEMLTKHRKQLLRWEKIIRREIQNSSNDFRTSCFNILLKEDPLLAGFSHMSQSVQKRERRFILNSIKGYEGYFKSMEKQR